MDEDRVTVDLTTATRVSQHRGAAADSVWAFCPGAVRRVTVVGVWPAPPVHLIGDRAGLERLRDELTAALADLDDPQGSTTARTVDSGPGAGPRTRSGQAGDRGARQLLIHLCPSPAVTSAKTFPPGWAPPPITRSICRGDL